uniref:Uncharacterized protein n=1 Tax=Glossina brevipalpis TaxID=37001 RepID=A0A1A9WAE7_9MUSC
MRHKRLDETFTKQLEEMESMYGGALIVTMPSDTLHRDHFTGSTRSSLSSYSEDTLYINRRMPHRCHCFGLGNIFLIVLIVFINEKPTNKLTTENNVSVSVGITNAPVIPKPTAGTSTLSRSAHAELVYHPDERINDAVDGHAMMGRQLG